MPKLTLLTAPIPVGKYYWFEMTKQIVQIARDWIKHRPQYQHLNGYRGHPAVTRSVLEGLQKIKVLYNYNPKSLSDVAETVIVLSGVRVLRQAIEFKKQGIIKKLIAGTNVASFPSMCPEFAALEVDLSLVNSDYVFNFFLKELPDLTGRCKIWPAGVDTSYWSPEHRSSVKKQVLLFGKQDAGPIPATDKYKGILSQKGYRVNTIKRGTDTFYTREEYKEALQNCSFMVGFSRSESQGLAWVEAWSMDVPTFLWQNDTNIINGEIVHTSTAPYLTEQTGCFFNNISDFEMLLDKWEAGKLNFSPRQWVLENMSDEVCARKLCVLAGIETNAAAI